jgi:hypothetical protein
MTEHKTNFPVWLRITALDLLRHHFNHDILQTTNFLKTAFHLELHERLLYKWRKQEKAIRQTASTNPKALRINALASVPSPTAPLQRINIHNITKQIPLSSNKYVVLNTIPTSLLQNLSTAAIKAFETREAQLIQDAPMKMVVIGTNYDELFTSNQSENTNELVDIIANGLKTISITSRIQHQYAKATFIQTNNEVGCHQAPHLDYTWNSIVGKQPKIPWSLHLPLTESGSYLFIWTGPGNAKALHIPYGSMLLLRADVVHAGGLPSKEKFGNPYTRLHMSLPFRKTDILDDEILIKNYDGMDFTFDYKNTYNLE